jgi:hypothetical protein
LSLFELQAVLKCKASFSAAQNLSRNYWSYSLNLPTTQQVRHKSIQ